MKKFPKGRTLFEFRPLQPAEIVLRQACAEGEGAVLGEERPAAKTKENAVRASFIRFLALGGDDEAPVHERGVQLAGAWIEGLLDLQDAVTPSGLSLVFSNFESAPVFRGAEIAGTLNLLGSLVPGLLAGRLQCKGDLFLSTEFTATGEVVLLGAQIDGSLDFNGAQLDGKAGDSLLADRAVIKGSVFLSNGFTSIGTVRLPGAQIGSNLEFKGAKLDGKDDAALSVDGAVIKGDVFLSEKFTATGEVRLLGAQIYGSLECEGATLDGKGGNSLSADRAVIKGGVFLSDGFTSIGTIRLPGAQIGSNLECKGATLDGKEGNALSADDVVIKGSVNLSDGFTSIGTVRLLGAQIDGNLECNGATLDGKNGNALSADSAVIKGSVNLSDGFTSIGKVRLLGVRIDGDLSCIGATLNGKSGVALACDGMRVTGSFFFRGLASVKGISLASAKVGRLVDDAASWGKELVLDDFVYDHLAGGAPTNAATRLAWIKKQSPEFIQADDFRPQPWKQLQKVLLAMGHTEDARQVGIDFEDHLRAIGRIGQTPADWQTWRRAAYSHVAKAFHFSFKWLIGYGYRPLRLGAWMVGVWLFCAIVYWIAALQGVMAPSNPLVFQNMPHYESCKPNWYLCEALPEEYTGFSPLAYSLDVLLPLVNLQQEEDWAALVPTPKNSWYQELFGNWSFKHLVRLVIWFEILFGWVASLLLVAVVSGLTKRSED